MVERKSSLLNLPKRIIERLRNIVKPKKEDPWEKILRRLEEGDNPEMARRGRCGGCDVIMNNRFGGDGDDEEDDPIYG